MWKHPRPRMRSSGLLLLLLILPFCGKKGPPQVPLHRVPLPPSSIELRQVGENVLFRWQNPQSHTDGSPLGEIREIQVFELKTPRGVLSIPPHTFLAQAILISHDPDLTFGGNSNTARLSGRVSAIPSRVQYFYGLRIMTVSDRISSLSPLALFLPETPPPAPRAPRVEVTPEHLRVCWESLDDAGRGTERPILGYNVYREEGGRMPWLPRNTTPVESTCFHDQEFRFGTPYLYAIRAILTSSPHLIESRSSSPPLSVHPRDIFPPPPPTDLRVIYEPGGVRLLWYPSSADDLAGYFVYRRKDDTPWRRLNPTPVLAQSFLDKEVFAGATYHYRVQAVDSSPGENESRPTRERTITVPPGSVPSEE